MSIKTVTQTFSIDKKLLLVIEKEVQKLGHGASLSGWIRQACIEKIENKNNGVENILKKLRDWSSTFPRKPLKQLVEEITREHYEKI